jgi:hypothetical protein
MRELLHYHVSRDRPANLAREGEMLVCRCGNLESGIVFVEESIVFVEGSTRLTLPCLVQLFKDEAGLAYYFKDGFAPAFLAGPNPVANYPNVSAYLRAEIADIVSVTIGQRCIYRSGNLCAKESLVLLLRGGLMQRCRRFTGSESGMGNCSVR